jgi:hypothetical protein
MAKREPRQRDVKVAEPQLSERTNEHLTNEVREVVGADRVAVPPDRPHVSRGERPEADGGGRGQLAAGLGRKNLMIVMMGASSVVIAAIIALLIGDWWILPLAFVVLAVVTGAIVAIVLRMTSVRERPSPATAAALEEEGVSDPERHFSELVAEYTPETGADRENRRRTGADEDAAQAAAEQESAITPSGGPTEPVGPGETP